MMKEYNSVSEPFLAEVRAVVGDANVFTEAEKLEQYKTDEEYDPRRFRVPEAVVRPANAEEIAAVVKLCNKYNVPLTVRSGGTSLADGAIAVCGGIVLLMERLNKIIEMNTEAMYVIAEAGVRTVDIQKMANEAGYLYAGDPCSAESCLIGGNLATNAGGNKAVRYGVTRNQVYSLEMVTPTGEIVEVGSRLKKCSTGYCMEQLVIGSEGTLGIITKVTLKLQPLPPYRFDLLAVFDDEFKALDVVPKIMQAGLNPTSVEFMDNGFVRAASDYAEQRLPHYEDGSYVIVTVETFNEDELDMKMEQLDEICTACGATDVVEADERVWKVRRSCLEGSKALSKVSTSDDLVVPIDKIAVCLNHLMEVSKQFDFECMCLAHAGDGNLHFNCLKMDMTDEEWEKQLAEFHKICYAYVYSLGGRLSGEHGIGAKKIDALAAYCDPVEMSIMKTIKRAMDPNNILNPGKLIRA
jgi:glycolate oxidase